MSASFQLSPEDFRLFQRVVGTRFVQEHGRFGLPFLFSVAAWFCVSMALAAFFRIWSQVPDFGHPFGVLVGLLVAGFLLAISIPYLAQRRFLARALSPRGAFLAPQTVQVSEEGLVFTSDASRSEVPWHSVLARAEDERNHYLFVDAMNAMVIPKSAVAALGPLFERKLGEVAN